MNIILRPVYNRPEMLYLSLEYEIKARDYFNIPESEYLTIFLIEYGAPQQVLDIIKDNYPYKRAAIKRKEKYGLSKNILTGMEYAFQQTDDYIIYIEDDVLIHKTYFQYMDVLLNMFSYDEFSVLSPFNGDDAGSVNEIYKGHYYAALAPLINKKFFVKYIKPCITPKYYATYKSRSDFCLDLWKKYGHYKEYKYKDAPTAHNEQAGLINKLVDIALIEDNLYTIMPYVNRQQHIGFFGKNRPGGTLPGATFEERLSNLRKIILDANLMYEYAGAKQYNDYRVFDPRLDKWDGKLWLKR